MWTRIAWTRAAIIGAVATYGLLAGGAMLAEGRQAASATTSPARVRSSGPVAARRDGLPYRCIGMQIQRVDWMDRYKESIDEIAAVGADTVKFVVDSRQENGHSSAIWLDLRMTPTPEALGDLIRHAKAKGLRVILMPIVLLDKPVDGEWRGQIKPENWDQWWESYREMETHFAWIAQANGVDVMVVGSELVSTELNTDEWRRTIAKVRETFKGKLTYSANWDHYSGIQFWDDLDLIGMNSYWKLGDNKDVTTDQIVHNWQKWKDEVLGFVKKKKKPLMFLEAGWCSMSNAASEPWDYTTGDPVDDELQKRLYEGFFRTWYGEPWLGGFSIWAWTPGDGHNDDNAKGYTPENKPAEKVLREWLAKPAWQVK